MRRAGFPLGAAIVATGLITGTYYAFACAVLPGLDRTDDQTFVTVMRRINEAIQNPVFFAAFFGALVLIGVAWWRHRGQPVGRWLLAALLCYLAGLVVTMMFNVPLNDQLAASGDPAAVARVRFESPWLAWNLVRTLASTAALAWLIACARTTKATIGQFQSNSAR